MWFQEVYFGLDKSKKLWGLICKACEVFNDFEFLMLPSIEIRKEAIAPDGLVVGQSGNGFMCLRRDWTESVARFLSKHTELELPLKVFYLGSTFSTRGESFQLGIEVIGDSTIDAEILVIKKIQNFLRVSALEDLKIIIGDVSIVRWLLRENTELFSAVLQKNLSALKHHQELRELVLAQGGETMVEDFARKYPELRGACERLLELGRNLQSVEFDLSEVRSQEYYSGMVFEFFCGGLPFAVAGGGRYDGLYRALGRDLPAVGGAIYLDALLEL
ncbi:MAG: ATP phosphoribosyltransferase regulatory subunit [Aquificaceae bacterium]